MVGSRETSFRGENLPTDPPESVLKVWNLPPTTGALESIAGGLVLTGGWTPLMEVSWLR